MRNTLQITILAMLILSAGCAKYDRELLGDPQPRPTPVPEVAVEDEQLPELADTSPVPELAMFDDLSYYGHWQWLEPYGWAWQPTVSIGWQPFTNGRWIWSQYGWMWVDYDNWGWATSHYGYWTYDYALGWCWIPDYTWAPVQCNWLIYEDYVCWSPVAPPGGHYRDPWDDNTGWVSVPMRRFKSDKVSDYRSEPKYKARDTRMVHRAAPDVNELAQHGARFKPVDVQIDRYPVGGHEVTRVTFPPDVYPPIALQPTPMPGPMPMPPPNEIRDPGNGGGTPIEVVQPPSQNGGKSKGSPPSKKDSGTKTETKYKSKKSNDNKDSGKSGGESKDDSTSKKKKGKKG